MRRITRRSNSGDWGVGSGEWSGEHMRITIATLIIGGGLLTMSIAEAQQPAAPGSDPNFTGVVTTMDAKDISRRPAEVRGRRADRVAQPRERSADLRGVGAHADRQARPGLQGIRRRRQ
jgi:hypothetical protein